MATTIDPDPARFVTACSTEADPAEALVASCSTEVLSAEALSAEALSVEPRLVTLSAADLARISGGANAPGSGATATATASAGGNDASFGRCGPGSSWSWLGNVYTPECAAHDAAVRGRLANGESGFMSHAKSLPLLPAAIGSYVRERLR